MVRSIIGKISQLSPHTLQIFKEKFKNIRVFGFDMISLTSKLDRDEGKKAHLDF